MATGPDVLELMIRHELAVKELYEAFAATLADRRDFWLAIAADEQRHADWLRALRSREPLRKWLASDSRLKAAAIAASIAYVESRTARAKAGRFGAVEALSVANDIENALLEKHFSTMSKPESPDMASILAHLTTETERHRQTLAEALAAAKG